MVSTTQLLQALLLAACVAVAPAPCAAQDASASPTPTATLSAITTSDHHDGSGSTGSSNSSMPTGATTGGVPPSIGTRNGLVCTTPLYGGVQWWYYNSKAEGAYRCTRNHDTKEWAMLSAFRWGSQQNVFYKLTDNENDGDCLNGWTIYNEDGQKVLAKVSGRTTTYGLNRRWCALPVYRSGGVLDKQWAYCDCSVPGGGGGEGGWRERV